MTETHETARLTADVALFGERDGVPHVLLIRRGWPPYEGLLAMPGGHVDPGETTEDAARRELAEETGIVVEDLALVGVYAAPGRDPRGRYASWAYRANVAGTPTPTAGDDADAAEWVPVADALGEDLAFDHGEILRASYVPRAVLDGLRGLVGSLAETDHGGVDLGVTPGGALVGYYAAEGGEEARWTATITSS